MTTKPGPGKSFRKGITLIEAVKTYGDEASAEAWFISQRWPDDIRCPHCESDRISERENRKPMPYHCRDCRKYFSVRTNTVLQSSNLSLSKWALAYFLFSTNLKGVSSMKLHRDLGSLKNQRGTWPTVLGSRGTRPQSGLPDRSRPTRPMWAARNPISTSGKNNGPDAARSGRPR